MNDRSFTRGNYRSMTTCVFRTFALLLMVLIAACGGDDQPSQDVTSEFGAEPTHAVEIGEDSPAKDLVGEIVRGVSGAVWSVACLFLGRWLSLLLFLLCVCLADASTSRASWPTVRGIERPCLEHSCCWININDDIALLDILSSCNCLIHTQN